MHIASANGYSKVVEFLLENHANVDALDRDGWTATHASACWGHVCILFFFHDLNFFFTLSICFSS